jgi:hypothetical protein
MNTGLHLSDGAYHQMETAKENGFVLRASRLLSGCWRHSWLWIGQAGVAISAKMAELIYSIREV